MKPDQHKKKRSAQYKKKHGIKNEDKKEEKSGAKKAHSAAGASANAGNKPDPRRPAEAEGKVPEDWSNREDEDGTLEGSFKRREIASNWERYGDIDLSDPEEQPLRGADFSALLEATSSAMSQFRFQEEKEWIVDDSPSYDLLTLNPDDIAAALECMPLHQRLDIEKDIFHEKDLQNYEEIAATNRKVYRPALTVEPSKKGKVEVDSVISLQNKLFASLKDEGPENNESASDSDDVLNDLLDQKFAMSSDEDSSEKKGDTSRSHKNPKTDEQIWNEDSDILDDLLNMTEAKQTTDQDHSDKQHIKQDQKPAQQGNKTNHLDGNKSNKGVESPSQKRKETKGTCSFEQSLISQKQMTHIEDELDQLLSLDDDSSESKKPVTTKQDGQDADKLEDWLDSVLDN